MIFHSSVARRRELAGFYFYELSGLQRESLRRSAFERRGHASWRRHRFCPSNLWRRTSPPGAVSISPPKGVRHIVYRGIFFGSLGHRSLLRLGLEPGEVSASPRL